MTELVRVDLDALRVWKGNQQINLAASDMRILGLLIRRAGRAVTHEQAFREAWGEDRCVSTVAVSLCVFRIRAQLGDGYIETIRTVGYRFVAERAQGATSHPAVRDVYDAEPAPDSVEEQVQIIARAGRLVDAGLKAYARRTTEGETGGYAGADDMLDRAEEYLKEAGRRFRLLRKLQAAAETPREVPS